MKIIIAILCGIITGIVFVVLVGGWFRLFHSYPARMVAEYRREGKELIPSRIRWLTVAATFCFGAVIFFGLQYYQRFVSPPPSPSAKPEKKEEAATAKNGEIAYRVWWRQEETLRGSADSKILLICGNETKELTFGEFSKQKEFIANTINHLSPKGELLRRLEISASPLNDERKIEIIAEKTSAERVCFSFKKSELFVGPANAIAEFVIYGKPSKFLSLLELSQRPGFSANEVKLLSPDGKKVLKEIILFPSKNKKLAAKSGWLKKNWIWFAAGGGGGFLVLFLIGFFLDFFRFRRKKSAVSPARSP